MLSYKNSLIKHLMDAGMTNEEALQVFNSNKGQLKEMCGHWDDPMDSLANFAVIILTFKPVIMGYLNKADTAARTGRQEE